MNYVRITPVRCRKERQQRTPCPVHMHMPLSTKGRGKLKKSPAHAANGMRTCHALAREPNATRCDCDEWTDEMLWLCSCSRPADRHPTCRTGHPFDQRLWNI